MARCEQVIEKVPKITAGRDSYSLKWHKVPVIPVGTWRERTNRLRKIKMKKPIDAMLLSSYENIEDILSSVFLKIPTLDPKIRTELALVPHLIKYIRGVLLPAAKKLVADNTDRDSVLIAYGYGELLKSLEHVSRGTMPPEIRKELETAQEPIRIFRNFLNSNL